MPTGILIHPTIWPQYSNITDRQTGQDRQLSDSTGKLFYKNETGCCRLDKENHIVRDKNNLLNSYLKYQHTVIVHNFFKNYSNNKMTVQRQCR